MNSVNQEQRVLITGASRGLGRSMALEFGRCGYRVAVHYVNSKESAEEVAAEILGAGGKSTVFSGNVANSTDCSELINNVVTEFGGLEVLINNAGITRDTLVLRMKDQDWQSVIDTNLSSVFYLAKAVLRGMIRQKFGRIINISSVSGLLGNAGQANYVAAKAGIIGLTKSLAREYAAKGITVNAVAPGFIQSDMTDTLPDELKEQYLSQIPVGRFGQPNEVAKAVVFLASKDASYINGQTLPVDGGMVMP